MLEKLKGISKGAAIRTGLLLLALVNTVLQLFGLEVLPFTEADVEAALSALFLAGAALSAWWKNNSFTKEAKEADKELKRKKARE